MNLHEAQMEFEAIHNRGIQWELAEDGCNDLLIEEGNMYERWTDCYCQPKAVQIFEELYPDFMVICGIYAEDGDYDARVHPYSQKPWPDWLIDEDDWYLKVTWRDPPRRS